MRGKIIALSILASIVLILFVDSSSLLARTVVLRWDSCRETEVRGYNVYYKPRAAEPLFHGTEEAEKWASSLDVGLVETATISGLDLDESYIFAVTAYNSLHLESDYSNFVEIPEGAPPQISVFSAPPFTTSMHIPVTFFATDNVAVSDYCITSEPSPSACQWSSDVPKMYTVTGTGTYSLYPWARDQAGNMSGTVAEPEVVKVVTAGDIDADGSVTLSDAQLALRFALGIATPTKEQRVRADSAPLNTITLLPIPDGAITIADVIVILRTSLDM